MGVRQLGLCSEFQASLSLSQINNKNKQTNTCPSLGATYHLTTVLSDLSVYFSLCTPSSFLLPFLSGCQGKRRKTDITRGWEGCGEATSVSKGGAEENQVQTLVRHVRSAPQSSM